MKDNYKNNNNAFPNNKNSYGTVSAGSDDRYAFKNIPQGLSFAFTQNAAAMTAFENMTDDQKKRVLDKASHVSSRKEMMQLVQNIATNNL